MHRPIGVILLAAGAFLAGLSQLYEMLVYLGAFSFSILGQSVSFSGNAQWGPALWALILAAIWFWVAVGFWTLRAYAIQFGIFISLFTLIWGFFAILFRTNSVENYTVPWILSLLIFMYLSYPGVQKPFVDNEMSKLTPEQRDAMEKLAAANHAAAVAMKNPTAVAPGMTPPPSAPTSTPPSTPAG